jgi:hypothetical protein
MKIYTVQRAVMVRCYNSVTSYHFKSFSNLQVYVSLRNNRVFFGGGGVKGPAADAMDPTSQP